MPEGVAAGTCYAYRVDGPDAIEYSDRDKVFIEPYEHFQTGTGGVRLNDNPFANAVLDDHDLQAGLAAVNPKFGDLCTRVAGEVWGQKLIPQKWKAFFAMTVDVANQGPTIAGSAFRAHLDMAIKQNATREEVEELMLFLCCYCGFNKVPHFLTAIREVFEGVKP